MVIVTELQTAALRSGLLIGIDAMEDPYRLLWVSAICYGAVAFTSPVRSVMMGITQDQSQGVGESARFQPRSY